MTGWILYLSAIVMIIIAAVAPQYRSMALNGIVALSVLSAGSSPDLDTLQSFPVIGYVLSYLR